MSGPRLAIDYSTTERINHSASTFSLVQRQVLVRPERIGRYPCGRGAARMRYHYVAYVSAPTDAAFARDGLIQCPIVRRKNPQFDPRAWRWDGNVGTWPESAEAAQ